MNDFRQVLTGLKARASSLSQTTDGKDCRLLLTDIKAFHRDVHAEIERMLASNRGVDREGSPSSELPWGDANAWAPSSLAQALLSAESFQATHQDQNPLAAFTEAIGYECSADRSRQARGCTAMLDRLKTLYEILSGLPLEDETYLSELRDAIDLDEQARKRVGISQGENR